MLDAGNGLAGVAIHSDHPIIRSVLDRLEFLAGFQELERLVSSEATAT